MSNERLAGIMERARLAAELDTEPAVPLDDVVSLLAEVYRCRREHTYVVRLAGRVRDTVNRHGMAWREDFQATIEAEVAYAAHEDTQEET
jgi:hypothetical protein